MEITEVRVKLMEDSDDRLQAFCSITFDNAFVVRDLKIIEGSSGPFVAMPSRKLTGHCHNCGSKNHLKAQYCNQCGARQREERATRDAEGRAKLYADIAHPVNSACREMIQARVIAEYRAEQERSKQPGYVSRYDDEYTPDDIDASAHAPPPHFAVREAASAPSAPVAAPEAQAPPPSAPQIQPAAQEPRPPHIAVPAPAAGNSGGPGPHFPTRDAAPLESTRRETAAVKPPPKKGDFGAGLF